MAENKNRIIIKFSIFVLVTLIIGVLFWKTLFMLFSNINNLKEFVLSFNFLSPLILILLIILQVLIAPIPGQAAGFVSGYLFGSFFGTIYSMIGLIIGSYIAFLLSRKYGRPFVEKVVNKKILKKFDKISSKAGVFTLFLIYLLPALPDDSICYIAGLTKIRIRTLVIISALGRFPGFFVLNLVGDGVSSYNITFSMLVLGAALFVSLLIYFHRDYLEKTMLKIVRKLNLKK